MTVESLCIHTVTIQQNVAVPDGRGGAPDSWTDLYTDVRCRIQPLSGDERTQWGGTPALITHRIYFHDTSLAITNAMQIVYGTRRFDVEVVRDIDEWGRFLTIDAREEEE